MLLRWREIAHAAWRHKQAINDYAVLTFLLPVVALVIGYASWDVLTWLLPVATGHAHL